MNSLNRLYDRSNQDHMDHFQDTLGKTMAQYTFQSGNSPQRLKLASYIVSLLILVILTAIQGGQIVYKYLQEPTYITSKYNTQGSSIIPSISICPDLTAEDTPNLKKEVLNKYAISGLESNEWRRPVKLLTSDDIFDLSMFELQ